MDRLQNTVRGIYGGNNITCLGPQNTPLPVEWESFFKRSAQGLRKQEPEPEVEEEAADLTKKILEAIIEKITGIESRLELIEGTIGEAEGEVVRKGTDPEIAELRAQMIGCYGSLVRKRGIEWQKN